MVVVSLEGLGAVLDARTGAVRHRPGLIGEPDHPSIESGSFSVTGEHDETMAVELASGRVSWVVEVGAEFTPPVVACRSVYLGDTSRTIALDQATGGQRWSVPVHQCCDLPPAIDGGLAFLANAVGSLRWTR